MLTFKIGRTTWRAMKREDRIVLLYPVQKAGGNGKLDGKADGR